MLAALIAADRDPHALAGLARKKMRAKTSVLRQLLTGHFTAHHAFLPGMIPGRIDELTAQIDTLTTRIEDAIAPFAPRSPQLDEIPGIGTTTPPRRSCRDGRGQVCLPPIPGHPVSWPRSRSRPASPPGAAKPPPHGQPLGRQHHRRSRHWRARTSTFLAGHSKLVVDRRGQKRAR
jgi:transposase